MKRRAWVCNVVCLQETEGHQTLTQQKRFIPSFGLVRADVS